MSLYLKMILTYDLAYEPVCRTPICSMLEKANWIYQGSFSKSLAPGLRLGYMVSSELLTPHLIRLKQAADLHSSRISQYFVLKMLTDPSYESRLNQIQQSYREKRDFFITYLDKYFSDIATWEIPNGGLFFWLTLKMSYNVDTKKLFETAIDQDIAFMPGTYFFPKSKSVSNHIRLNFSHASRDDIVKGLSTLSGIIHKHKTLSTH